MKINSFFVIFFLTLISFEIQAKRALSERVVTKKGRRKRVKGHFDVTNPTKVKMLQDYEDLSKENLYWGLLGSLNLNWGVNISDKDRVLEGKERKIYARYLAKMESIPKENKKQLYTELADKIMTFNKHANRKLELFLGSHDDFKRNLSQNYQPMAQNFQEMKMSRPTINSEVIPELAQKMPNQMPMIQNNNGAQMNQMNQMNRMNQMNQMNQINQMNRMNQMNQMNRMNNGVQMNQMQNNGKRKLFIGGLINSVGGAAGSLVGGAGDAAKSVAGGLGANGGAGAGLLGAGAGLMMATMGADDERNERENLEQELRSKEFRFMMENGKKTSEMGLMDKSVRK